MVRTLGIIAATTLCLLGTVWIAPPYEGFPGPEYSCGLMLGILLRGPGTSRKRAFARLVPIAAVAFAIYAVCLPAHLLLDLPCNLFGAVVCFALLARWIGPMSGRLSIRQLILLTLILAPLQSFLTATARYAVAEAISDRTIPTGRFLAIEWLSNWLGTVLIAPIAILWPRLTTSPRFWTVRSIRIVQAALLGAVGLVASMFFSSEPNSLLARSWPLSGLLILAAVRFSPLMMSMLCLVYSYFVVWFTLRSFGPFIDATIDPVWTIAAMSLILGSITATAVALTLLFEQRRETEVKLRESLRFANAIFEHSPIAIQVFQRDGFSFRMNESQRAFLGVPSKDYGIGIFNVLTDPLMVANGNSATFRRVYGGETIVLTGLSPDLNRPENVWEVNPDDNRRFDYLVYPLTDELGRVDAVVSFIQDTTLRTRAEESLLRTSLALQQSQALLRAVIDNTPCLISARDMTQRFLVMNAHQARLFGTTPAAAIGRTTVELLGRTDPDLSQTHTLKVLENGRTCSYDEVIADSTGVERNWHTVCAPLIVSPYDADSTSGVVSISVDITERKRDEATILSSLHEKETLLKEIHHRVKNNLAVIIGLLGLQIRRTGEPAIRAILQESQNRIGSMSVVHELLYRSSRLSGIDLPEYIEELSKNLLSSYSVIRDRIRLTSEVGGISLDLDTAIPVGLILNELISNSLKHAFPDSRRGNVVVRVVRTAESMVTLTVEDDGVGFADSEAMFETRSLGLRLVRNLTQQIRGHLSVRGDRGSRFEISFPNPERGTIT